MSTETIEAKYDDSDLDWTGSEGAEAAEESSKGQGGIWRRPGYFSLKDKETELVRFLSDREVTPGAANQIPWVTVKVHTRAPVTSSKPEGHDGTWPETMSATCRADKLFTKRYAGECPLCKTGHKAKPRTFALAVLRQEVLENGKLVGSVDKKRQVQKLDESGDPIEGEVEEVSDVRIVEQSWFGFFDKLAGMSARWRTLANRDIQITRKGAGKTDTEYTVSADDPIQVQDPDDPSKITVYDVRDPRFWARYAAMGEDLTPNLRSYVVERCSDAYLGRFFSGKGAGGSGGKATSGQPAAPRTEKSAEEVQATKDSIMGRLQRPADGGAEQPQGGDQPAVMARY